MSEETELWASGPTSSGALAVMSKLHRPHSSDRRSVSSRCQRGRFLLWAPPQLGDEGFPPASSPDVLCVYILISSLNDISPVGSGPALLTSSSLDCLFVESQSLNMSRLRAMGFRAPTYVSEGHNSAMKAPLSLDHPGFHPILSSPSTLTSLLSSEATW